MERRRRMEHAYQVRFDEADADGRLRPSGFLRYAQDMAWRHSEESGFDRSWYDERSMHWLVRNVELRLHGPVDYGAVLNIATEVTGWRHVWARRLAEVRRGDDLVATVETDWVLLRDDGRPAPVPPEIASYFSPGSTFSRSRVPLPEPTSEPIRLSTRVRPIDVDPLKHMNNAAYLDVVDDGLGRMADLPPGKPNRYRIGYVRPALPGSAIQVQCWAAGEDTVACRIDAGDGEELTRVLVSWTEA